MSAKNEVGKDWLTESYDYKPPRRGQIRQGVILKHEEQGITVDVGLKRDGFVPRSDVDRLEGEALSQLESGQEVVVRVVQVEDQDGRLILSLYQAQIEKDWDRAEELLAEGDLWHGTVTGYNKGGLLVKFGQIRAFVPASHLVIQSNQDFRRKPEQRQAKLALYVGEELPLKVIQIDRDRRRLILSERLAREQLNAQAMERLLNELIEGQVCRGVVSQLRKFGAFVDLGGAKGLIHISELSWRRIQHPNEVVQVGDEIEVYVLNLDHKRKRISLSLKRLQPSPWTTAETIYDVGQLVPGTVTNVVAFGAFVVLESGIEGLVHISEMGDPAPQDPRQVVQSGDELILRIIYLDTLRRRIRFSLKMVSDQEREEWLAQHRKIEELKTGENNDPKEKEETKEESLPTRTEQTSN
jgi:small subunit ribosomal protein S1